jgi:hypothetical protein
VDDTFIAKTIYQDLKEKAMSANNALMTKDQSNVAVYDRDASRSAYGAKRYECDRITIIEKSSGMTYEFQKNFFGSLSLEHDGVRTVVEKSGLLGNEIFVTYEPVSFQIQH